MEIYYENNNLILDGVVDFDIEDILECGQCFRFEKLDEKDYEIIAFGKYLHIVQTLDKVTFMNTTYEMYKDVWEAYFDMNNDYSKIKKTILEADDRLKPAIKEKSGIRILNQEFFETLISFIISQNKHIPHIKQIVKKIATEYGEEILLEDGRVVYAFPTMEAMSKLSKDDLLACKVGFRASYIMDAITKCMSGEIDKNKLTKMSYEEAKKSLITIKGVGEKVSSCVLLFSLGYRNAFPIDVWMKRIMQSMYFEGEVCNDEIVKFAYDKFGEYSGYAQQYLFYYGRENNIGK